jgi:hypothetical protein
MLLPGNPHEDINFQVDVFVFGVSMYRCINANMVAKCVKNCIKHLEHEKKSTIYEL